MLRSQRGGGIVTRSRKRTYLIVSIGLLAGLLAALAPRPLREEDTVVVRHVALKPEWPAETGATPPEVREFLGRVLEHLPERGAGFTGYRFFHWELAGKPTHEAVGLKAVPVEDPEKLIDRVRDVDRYVAHIAHVDVCRSEPDPTFTPPKAVRFYQVISIPGVAKVQHVLVLADAGTIRGYRLAYWYLLKDRTASLNPKAGARSDFNVGVWLVAPGAVAYAMSCWPRRDDVNALQWVSMTTGADVLAKRMVERNIDGMVAWMHDEVNRPR
jgi:hypothetical protein